MNQMPFGEPEAKAKQKKKMSTGAKLGIGCGIAFLVVLLLVCAGVFFSVQWGLSKLDAFAEPFEQKGYQRVSTQVVQVTAPITQPTVYTAQIVNLQADANADIAVLAQMLEIRGNVNGDVDFQGQVVTVHPGAVITGNLRLHGAQAVRIFGDVEGEISGTYSQLDDQRPKPPGAGDDAERDETEPIQPEGGTP